MSEQIYCAKLKEMAEPMSRQPFPGELGDKIYQNISKTAWKMWLSHQTMLINEYRLSLIEPQAVAFLREEMNKYFFGEGSEKPSGWASA
jgi:Fe-S cluster biosynthesis and repair protein YggX